MGEREDLIDQVVSEIDLSMKAEPHKDHTVLPFWVDREYKKKFEELQSRSEKDFGKKAKDLLYRLIDKAYGKL